MDEQVMDGVGRGIGYKEMRWDGLMLMKGMQIMSITH